MSWIGFRASWLGMADVSVDGGAVTRIDLYAPTEVVQVPVFTVTGLSAGSHTLRIDVPGLQNPSSTAAWVVVDAFDVVPVPAPSVTRVQETDPSIAFTADWTQSGVSNLWSGEIGERGFGTGLARVSLDGQFIAQVDTSTTLQEGYQAVLFSATGLTPGSHTLTIDVIGRNNEPPGATVERVVVDAFDVY